ncbi:MAG: hypothetical protein ACK5GN_00020 [Pseudomonadota bacterium]|jgi:hypothetical protein
MFRKKTKLTISDIVLEKIAVAAEIAGCASPDEFAERALLEAAERVISSTAKREASPEEVEAIKNQLAGLGYLE